LAVLGVLVVMGIVVGFIVVSVLTLGRRARDLDSLGTAREGHEYRMGQTARSGDLEFRVERVEQPFTPPSGVSAPQRGDEYVEVDIQIRNLGRSSKAVSSVLLFQVVDAEGDVYGETSVAGVAHREPEGAIPAGHAARGDVLFEVPEHARGLELRCQVSPTSPTVIFALS
jgi:hypothetical protein